MIALLALAVAAERGPGTWEIGANPAGAGEGWVSAGVTQVGLAPRVGSMVLPGAEAFVGVTDSVAVQVRGQAGPVFADGRTYPLFFGYAGARWLVVDKPSLRVAPTLGALGVKRPNDDSIGGAALGVALDAGGERLRFDMSWPLVGWARLGTESLVVPPWAGLLVTEIGLTVRVGDHSVRVGTTAWFPTVTLRLRPEGPLFVDVSVGGAPEFGPTAGLQVGATFGGS